MKPIILVVLASSAILFFSSKISHSKNNRTVRAARVSQAIKKN
jgi:hypothetical protein